MERVRNHLTAGRRSRGLAAIAAATRALGSRAFTSVPAGDRTLLDSHEADGLTHEIRIVLRTDQTMIFHRAVGPRVAKRTWVMEYGDRHGGTMPSDTEGLLALLARWRRMIAHRHTVEEDVAWAESTSSLRNALSAAACVGESDWQEASLSVATSSTRPQVILRHSGGGLLRYGEPGDATAEGLLSPRLLAALSVDRDLLHVDAHKPNADPGLSILLGAAWRVSLRASELDHVDRLRAVAHAEAMGFELLDR